MEPERFDEADDFYAKLQRKTTLHEGGMLEASEHVLHDCHSLSQTWTNV